MTAERPRKGKDEMVSIETVLREELRTRGGRADMEDWIVAALAHAIVSEEEADRLLVTSGLSGKAIEELKAAVSARMRAAHEHAAIDTGDGKELIDALAAVDVAFPSTSGTDGTSEAHPIGSASSGT
jgi:hypothetical protein